MTRLFSFDVPFPFDPPFAFDTLYTPDPPYTVDPPFTFNAPYTHDHPFTFDASVITLHFQAEGKAREGPLFTQEKNRLDTDRTHDNLQQIG